MIQFTYAFCMAMLHSFWQATLLLLLYITVDTILHKNNAPLAKRNILYTGIIAQLVLFVLTFFIYFFNTAAAGNFLNLTQKLNIYFGSENIRSITPWIFSLYVFIITYKFTKAIYSWYYFKQQYRSGLQKPPVELKIFTELKSYQFGIKRKVKLWLSSSIHTPVTFGFFKPIILLPVALLNKISLQQAETLILHELTHIRTNDYLLNWVLLVAETLFFFNPFVISICKKIRLERELNCDIQVISFEYPPALYAETLLQAERMKQPVHGLQLAAVNSKKHLLQRIQFFTSEKIIGQQLRYRVAAPLIGLILLILLSAAVLFQSAKLAVPVYSAIDQAAYPFDNYFVSNYKTGNDQVANKLFDNKKNKLVENSLPVVKNKLQPVSKPTMVNNPMKAMILDLAKPAETDYVVPVAQYDNNADRRIIIKEEGSESASVKVYYLSFKDGKWILQPEWVLSAKEMQLDSLKGNRDTIRQIKRMYPAQQ